LPRYIEDYHTHIRKLAETHPATTVIYTLSLHDALPISTTKSGPPSVDPPPVLHCGALRTTHGPATVRSSRTTPLPYPLWKQELRSEEHTSELQSREKLVCRLLLEKKTASKIASLSSGEF